MESDGIGRREIRQIVGESWRWIVALSAACGLAAFVWWSVLLPTTYAASASVMIRSPLEGGDQEVGAPELWHTLARSGRVVEKTNRLLIEEQVLEQGKQLRIDRELTSRVVLQGRGRDVSSSRMIELTALGDTPEQAAATANRWTAVLLEESNSMLPKASGEAERVLGEQISPTRVELEQLATEEETTLIELQEREEKISTTWDQRISSAKSKLERSLAAFQAETRRLLQEVVTTFEEAAPGASATRSRLLELAAVRSQLAQTPRILTLEKAAGDEALAEMVTEGLEVARLDNPLITEEVNPLYDQLAVRTLELESAITRLAANELPAATRALEDLERIQVERAAAQAVLTEQSSLELKLLRRRRSRALEEIERERTRFLEEMDRRQGQLADLEERLALRQNAAVLARLLGEVEPIALAAPAVPSNIPISRQVPLKVALATFLGGMLGLMIGLFRSSTG